MLKTCTGWVTFLKLDATYFKFVEPGLTAYAFKIVNLGITGFNQGTTVSATVAIVPPMLEESIGEELFLSTNRFRAGIGRREPLTIKQWDRIPIGRNTQPPI